MKNLKNFLGRIILFGLLSTISLKAWSQEKIFANGSRELLISGLRVVLKPSVNKVVSAKLVFFGGTRNYTLEQQGIENAALAATAECGTTHLSRNVFFDRLESLGSSIDGISAKDNGVIELRCIRKNWDASWDLFSDAIKNPSFDSKEFELLKQKLIAQVLQRESNPDGSLEELAKRTIFKGTPYELRPEGDSKSLTRLTSSDVKNYYAKILNKSQLFLVVVGNIDENDLKKKVENAFASIPGGSYTPPVASTLDISTSDFQVEPRQIATNYIMGAMGAPSSQSTDFRAFQVGIRVLYDHMFREVRTKRNLSYAPAAFMQTSLINSSGLYVTTTQPNVAAKVMLDELNAVRKNGFTEKEIKEKKSEFLTSYFMQQESNSAQASSIASAQVLYNDWKRAMTITDEINAVQTSQVNEAMKKYIKAVKWVYLGKPEEADPMIFKQPVIL